MNDRAEMLLKHHREHVGVYARVAKKLGVSSGYVSLVASGARRSEKIMAALIRELRRIESL